MIRSASPAPNNGATYEPRPQAGQTDYAAFAKDVLKRFPKVMAHLAK